MNTVPNARELRGAFVLKPEVERLVFRSPSVAIGTFRCPIDHPLFRDSGPSTTHCFVFPRSCVSIRHAGAAPFVADPSIVTFYNAGQEYSRGAVSPTGDRADWFAVAPDIADEIVRTVARMPHRNHRIFPFTHARVPPSQYLEQRMLFERLRDDPSVEPLGVEEAVLTLLASLVPVAARSYLRAGLASTARQRTLVEDAKVLLAQSPDRRLHLADLASQLSCSVFHLCRVFRQLTGATIHGYRSDVRLRLALEPLADTEDITRIAMDLGFCSHSHFTASFRRHFGLVPSEVRRRLRSRRTRRRGHSLR